MSKPSVDTPEPSPNAWAPKLDPFAARSAIRFGDIRTKANPYRKTADLYHRTMRARWRTLIPLAILVYVIVNLFFAALYLVGEGNIQGARPGSFVDAFFFSVQTLSTIGYGGMVPATTWANTLVTSQAFLGIALTAVATGLAFAKFARAPTHIIFSEKAVVFQRNGKPCLSFRAANSRGTDIVEAHMHVNLLRSEVSNEGMHMRSLVDLPLVRDRSPVFLLSWAVMHEIDDDSPLHGLALDDLVDDNCIIICTLLGVDGTTGQTTTTRQVYHAQDIVFGHTLVDIIEGDADGAITLNYENFHQTAPQSL